MFFTSVNLTALIKSKLISGEEKQMRIVFIVLMILLAIAVAVVAALNNEIVTVHYLFGQVELTLFAVILGSTFTGILIMVLFGIYRTIHNYIKSESERNLKKELQQRIKLLERENKKLEEEVEKLKKERENAAEKSRAELEAEKNKLEEELNKQRKEREEIIEREQTELGAEKERLEEELRRQKQEELRKSKQETGSLEADEETQSPPKKSFWDFLKS